MVRFQNCDFVPLHVHSEYSKFDGLQKVAKLVMKARQMGFPAVALTDHGTVGGWVKLIAECNRKKDKDGKEIPYPTIKPIVGCEFYLSRDHNWHGLKAAKLANPYFTGPNLQPEGSAGNRHIVLIAKNWEGYQNICRLSEASWIDGFYGKPRVDIEQLAKHSKGVMAQSACLSSVVNACLLNDKYDAAKAAVSIFKDIYGEDFALEAMYHGISEEGLILPDIMRLGAETDTPVLATNDTHFTDRPQAMTHEILMCMNTNKCVLDPKRLHFPYPEFYLKSADEMGQMFSHHPEVIYNTRAWAERIDSKDIETNMGGMRLPSFQVPAPFKSSHEYLESLAWEGMRKLRWDQSPAHVECLKKELADVLIAKTNNNYDFSTYFLIVWDYVNHARENGILTGCGRGSGYASVLLRALGITYGPDPIKYGLLWERFLGFDDKRFIKDSDFGLDEGTLGIAEMLDAVEELGEDAELEDDEEVEEEFLEV